jgi:hypothetical protein
MNFNNLKIQTLSPVSKGENPLDLSYDLTLIPRHAINSSAINLYYTEKSIKKLLQVIPELNNYDFKNFIIYPGEEIANIYLKRINSPFTFKVISSIDKLSPEDYSKTIYSWQLPLVNRSVQFLHDFYMHGLGAYLIPDNFISWWRENKHLLCDKEKLVLASVVEWTTIKFASSCIEESFHCDSWKNLSHYLHCSPEEVDLIYSKYPAKEFIKHWKLIK